MVKRSYVVIFIYVIAMISIAFLMTLLIEEIVNLHQLINLPDNAFVGPLGDKLIHDSGLMFVQFSVLILPFLSITIVVWRSERRRQRAMKGKLAAHYLAVQPEPMADALPLPTAIDLYLNQRLAFLQFIFAHVLLFGLWLFIVLAFLEGNFLITLPFLAFCECGLVVLFIRLPPLNAHQRIEIAEEGISKLFMGRWRRTVRWQDARLFALVATNSSSSAGSLDLAYELASNTESIRWSEIQMAGMHGCILKRELSNTGVR